MGILLLIVLACFLLGAVPRWNYSRNWGYGPSGLLSLLFAVVLVLVLLDVIPHSRFSY